MKFKYLDCTPDYPEGHKIFRPLIQINLRYGKKSVDLFALVDSGADVCLFPSEVGESLGIVVEKGTQSSLTGIGEIAYPTFSHSVVITIGKHKIKTPVHFSDAIPTPLLGQKGFFDHFDVKFSYAQGEIEIILSRGKI
jgi:predicted aspartyl protease